MTDIQFGFMLGVAFGGALVLALVLVCYVFGQPHRQNQTPLEDKKDFPKGTVEKVWVDPGCIVCDLCSDVCPDVFEVTDKDVFIKPEGEFHPEAHSKGIVESAVGCPVSVIKYKLKAAEKEAR
jgi:ferredoxin